MTSIIPDTKQEKTKTAKEILDIAYWVAVISIVLYATTMPTFGIKTHLMQDTKQYVQQHQPTTIHAVSDHLGIHHYRARHTVYWLVRNKTVVVDDGNITMFQAPQINGYTSNITINTTINDNTINVK